MRVVAVAAILGNRCMLPKVRATLFGMAVEACLVQSLLSKLPFTGFTVCAVATTAVHLALPDRMRIRLERLRALLLVAFEAHFGLCRCHQYRILGGVTRMAIGACNIIHVVVVAMPAKTRIGCMTIQAKAVLHIDGRAAALAKNCAWRSPLLAATNASRVIT